MTLRELFNSILDYPVVFEFNPNPWGLLIGVVIGISVLLFVEWRWWK